MVDVVEGAELVLEAGEGAGVEAAERLEGDDVAALPVAGRVDGAHAAPSEQLEHREAIGAFEGPGLPLRHPVPRIASSSVKARGGGGASSAR